MTINGSSYRLSETEQAFFKRHLAIAEQGTFAQGAVQGALQLLVDQHNLQAQPGHGFNLSEDMTAIIEVPIDGMAGDR